MFTTNVVSAFVCAREAVKRMSTRYGGKGGAIVNVSSGAARLGSPEVAQAIVWLLSDESSYTTGSFIEVAGGK